MNFDTNNTQLLEKEAPVIAPVPYKLAKDLVADHQPLPAKNQNTVFQQAPVQIEAKSQTAVKPALPSVFVPGVIKFLLLIPLLLTTLYARSYNGEYQIFINYRVTGTLYVILGSVLLSLILFWQKPWKPVVISTVIVVLLNLLHILKLSSSLAVDSHSMLIILFSRNANTVNFFYYGLGAAVSYLILWLIHHNSAEARTEVY